MDKLLVLLSNYYVLAYVVIIIFIQWLYGWRQSRRKQKIANRRINLGLPKEILVKQSKKLEELKDEARNQALALILPIVLLPFILSGIAWYLKSDIPKEGLLFTFLIFIAWLAFSGTDLAKAAIGGIAFRTVMSFANTIQIGDRVTINGYSGKLIDIGIFYLTLVTADDDKVCLPSNSLWGVPLVSANDGDRSSLCLIPFYLPPTISSEQLQQAEDTIWDAVQASNYYEPTKPKQIYYRQHQDYIELTAKAYVASTYNEPLFKSDITRRFLQFVKSEGILLANQRHSITVEHNDIKDILTEPEANNE